jgi:hypothetical protein
VSFAEADGGAPIAVEGLAQPFVLVLNVSAREQQMHLRNRSGVQGAHSSPLGLFLRTLHIVFVVHSECLPARSNPLAERACLFLPGLDAAELQRQRLGPRLRALGRRERDLGQRRRARAAALHHRSSTLDRSR